MLFNSFSFVLFFLVVFITHWFIAKKSLSLQNLLLLVASYYFYSRWDYRFAALLLFSTGLDFWLGHKISNDPGRKKIWFWTSIITNLGILVVFKYYNFFVTSFQDALSLSGININFSTLNILLPIGISFYTFHGLSYIIDIYKGKINPEKDFVKYAVFVSFFPLLVAGPIERATHLLPQFQQPRVFDQKKAVDGLRQILLGLFKKIVIADNCAEYVNFAFHNPSAMSASTLVLAASLFGYQVYCDFSGYSDIAVGTAKLLGIDLIQNFNFPYFSRNCLEFWRRWHISLTSWFTDYVYKPLSRKGLSNLMNARNVFIVFVLSALWHGAKWTFVIWGVLNAIFIIHSTLVASKKSSIGSIAKGKNIPPIKDILAIFVTYLKFIFAGIFFRAENMTQAKAYVSGLFSKSIISVPNFPNLTWLTILFIICIGFTTSEWFMRNKVFSLQIDNVKSSKVRMMIYYVMILMIIFLKPEQTNQFIYFQF